MSPLFLMIRTRAAFAGDNREYRIRACLKKALERQVGKMSRKEEYEQKAEALLSPIVESNGFELVDVEYVKEAGNWYLRGYIDKPGGITVNDCETVSRAFSDRLDEDDFIEDSYIMEISSPGLDRPLKKEKDFARSIGKLVEIRTYRPIEKQKEFCGELTAYDNNSVTIDEEGTPRTFDKKDIALVRLAIDFEVTMKVRAGSCGSTSGAEQLTFIYEDAASRRHVRFKK